MDKDENKRIGDSTELTCDICGKEVDVLICGICRRSICFYCWNSKLFGASTRDGLDICKDCFEKLYSYEQRKLI